MTIYSFNNSLHKYKNKHDETGGMLKDMHFKYYDCFCGCPDFDLVSTTTRHQNQFTVVRCLYCSTLRINPYMTDNSTVLYYKDIYGRVKRKGIDPEILYENQKTKKDSIDLFEILSKYVQPDEKVLDYGAGAGGRLDGFMKQNYKKLYLFEHDEKYLNYGLSKGFQQHNEDNKYKLIILSHVIEHIGDPVKVLSELSVLLVGGGYIYIEVPMYENTSNILSGFHLAHKFYFTNMSLTLLGNIAGLQKVDEYTNAIVVTPGSVDAANFDSVQAANLWRKCRMRAKTRDDFRRIREGFKHMLGTNK